MSNDGIKDIEVTNPNSNTLSIFLGVGNGTFNPAPGSPVTVGAFPYSVNAADFDLNGTLDLAITSALTNTVGFLFGNGNGTFTVPSGSPITVGNDPQSMILGDFNGDGKTDISISNYVGATENILINTIPAALSAAFTLSSSPICAGLSVNFTSTSSGGPTSYTWNFGDLQTSNLQNPTHTYSSPGTYTVSLTVSNSSGSNTHTQTIVVNPSSVAGITLTGSATILPGSNILLTGSGGGSYMWSPPDGLSCTACPNPVATPTITTTYCLTVTDFIGCANQKCITINVEPCGEVFVPSVFSPNDDGQNDFLNVYGQECIKSFDFIIYDRWGEKVFETNNPKQGWDGTYKGQFLNTSVFVYYLKAILISGQTLNEKGNITLMR